MPKTADPTVRVRLIEAAARILAEEGPSSLTLRRVASEVGTSTMAVYTHFGGMTELRRAVREQGFERLAEHMAAVVPSVNDPVVRLLALGRGYFQNALDNPHLYRAMFVDHPVEDDGVGIETFFTLVDAVRDCIEAGRFRRADPEELARQIWVGIHGVVTLHLAGLMPRDLASTTCLEYVLNLCIGFGDTPRRLKASLAKATMW